MDGTLKCYVGFFKPTPLTTYRENESHRNVLESSYIKCLINLTPIILNYLIDFFGIDSAVRLNFLFQQEL